MTRLAPNFVVGAGNDRMFLRPAEAADQPFIRQLFKTARADSFAAGQFTPGMLDTVLEQQFRAQSVGYAARYPAASSLLIDRNREPIGRLVLSCDTQRWHIVDILLLPSAQGIGIGVEVIRAVIRAARTQGANQLTLMVLASNVAARRLYLRLGFVETADAVEGTHVAMALRLAAFKG